VLRRMVIAVFVGTPLVMLTTAAAWVAVEAWAFDHRPAAVLSRKSEKIRTGMRLEEVHALLGNAGKKIDKSELPEVVDWDVPVDSPRRSKPVVSGESFYQWQADGGAYVIVSLRHGVVHEKFFYAPSL
jgi:hypothetical protein